ncbi:MAG: hypothetical protein JWO03_1964 [Bacteroidetes bacterium]|nr:hypothetical protein [Bacteroidota bacterium]
MEPHLRRLTPDDWQLFKAIRLEALQNEFQFFGGQYSIESVMTDDEWKDRLADPHKRAYWGMYDGDECVGLTGVVYHREYPDAVIFIASYIRKEYRGRKLSALFYEARIAWAKAEGYKLAHISHRGGNDASRGANQKFGFKYLRTDSITWHDGTSAEELFYTLEL